MSAPDALDRMSAAGVTVEIDGENLLLEGDLSDEQIQWARDHKTDLLAALRAREPLLTSEDRADIEEAIEERAAIQEFDGGLPRAEAERQARARMRVYQVRVAQRTGDPIWIVQIAPGCDLPEARAPAERQFGTERVLEIKPISEPLPAR